MVTRLVKEQLPAINTPLARVLDVLRQHFGVRASDKTHLSNLQADEMDWEEIQKELEIEFDLSLNYTKMTECKTVADLVTLVSSK